MGHSLASLSTGHLETCITRSYRPDLHPAVLPLVGPVGSSRVRCRAWTTITPDQCTERTTSRISANGGVSVTTGSQVGPDRLYPDPATAGRPRGLDETRYPMEPSTMIENTLITRSSSAIAVASASGTP